MLKIYRKIKKLFHVLFLEDVNWIKTVQFNYRMLPLAQARYLPIWLYGKVDIGGGGKIDLHTHTHTGSWKIGKKFVNFMSSQTRMIIEGTLKLSEKGTIGRGSVICIEEHGRVSLGKDILLVSCRLSCHDTIEIGDFSHVSWECQIMDTDFHYMIKENKIYRKDRPIIIGKEVWIGNRVTIGKGSHLGDGCVVASNSYVNKDYSGYERYVFAGTPAKPIGDNTQRIFDVKIENELNTYFYTHPNKNFVNIEELNKSNSL